jgi:hypothetical protein
MEITALSKDKIEVTTTEKTIKSREELETYKTWLESELLNTNNELKAMNEYQ